MKKKVRILFQGDSITDAGRNRWSKESLAGYPKKTAAILCERCKDVRFSFFNRGISGNRVKDLLARYKKHFVKIKPDIVTVMIGINDVWRAFDRNDYTSSETYRDRLTQLFCDLKRDTNAKIIVLSPYLTPDKKHDEMRGEVDRFIMVCEKVAAEYADAYINTDIPMNIAAKTYGADAVSKDGVHPAEEGQKVLAKLLSDKIIELL